MNPTELKAAFDILANQDAIRMITANPTNWKAGSPERYVCQALVLLSKARVKMEADHAKN